MIITSRKKAGELFDRLNSKKANSNKRIEYQEKLRKAKNETDNQIRRAYDVLIKQGIDAQTAKQSICEIIDCGRDRVNTGLRRTKL